MSNSKSETSRSDLLKDLALDPAPEVSQSLRGSKSVLLLAAICALLLSYWLYPAVIASLNTAAAATSLEERATSLAAAGNADLSAAPPSEEQKPGLNNRPPFEARPILDASGYVVARRQATVSAKITGKVEQVLVNEGDFVSAGQLLATLDSSLLQSLRSLRASELREREASMAELHVQLEEARRLLQRTTQLHAKGLISVAEFDNADLAFKKISAARARADREIESAQNQLNIAELQLLETQIRAPFDGVVVSRSAQAGEIVSPMSAGGGFTRTGICSLVDMDSLELEVEVNEANIQLIRRGQQVVARLNSYPDWAIPAEVVTLIPTADRTKATIKLRIRLLESDTRILPEMGVRVAFY